MGKSISNKNRLWVCSSEQLIEGVYQRIEITYSGKSSSVLVFRLNGQCMAYRNLCVHMPRELDCEKNTIFDSTGQKLRCSMHGIVYDPMTGESISTMCNGERLTAIRVQEDDEGVWIQDKRVKLLKTTNKSVSDK